MIKLDYPNGATPLDHDEMEGLLLTHITNREELNRWEHDNIREALEWLDKEKPTNILNVTFILHLHKKMFGNVWSWAGNFRKSGKNIGVSWTIIAGELQKICNETEIWIKEKTLPPDEIAILFHHRLTKIHPFPNGNGRHAREMTNLLLENLLGQPLFTWGSANLVQAGECRDRYIRALQAADGYDFDPLFKFVRT